MIRLKAYLLLIFFIAGTNVSYSQNITGRWEGVMEDEWLVMNVIQKGNQLCGFTHDYILNDKSSYCKAYFRGRFDPESKMWSIYGVSFIENSGAHVLMELRFWRKPDMVKNTIYGTVSLGSSFFGMRNESRPFLLRRVSGKPTPPPDKSNVCFEEPKPPVKATIKKLPVVEPPAPPVVKKTAPVVKVPAKKPVVKTKIPVKKALPVKPAKPVVVTPVTTTADTIKKIIPATSVVTAPKKEESLVKAMAARKKHEVSRLVVNTKNIQLALYDNGIVDNDTVSIFYNGRLLVNKQKLSEKSLQINLQLDDNTAIHEITMFAQNLGTIPPNTALVVVTAGDKRYELHSSASLTENAVLVFEYKPK